MADQDDIDIAIRLRDELTEVARRVERQLEELERQIRDNTQATDENTQSTDENTNSLNENARAARAAQQPRDEFGRFIRQGTQDIEDNTVVVRRNTRSQRSSAQQIKKTAKGFQSFGKILGLIKMGTMLDAISQATAGISALGGAAMSAVAGLAPLTGALLPLPGMLGALGQGAVAGVIGFKDIFKAAGSFDPSDMTKFNEATKDLGPNARDAAIGMGALLDELKPIKGIVQEEIWQDMLEPIRDLADNYVPLLEEGMRMTGASINRVLQYTTGFLNLEETVDAIGRIMYDNAQMVEFFGHAANGALRGFIHLADATGPVGVQMAEAISRRMNLLADIIYLNQERITAFAQRGYDLMKEIGSVLNDFFWGMFNIGKLSMGLAGEMGGKIRDIATNFRAWTESEEGRARIQKFFQDIRPVMQAVGNLIVALAQAFAALSTNDSLADIINQVAEMVPTFQALVEQASGKFIPALLDIASSLMEVVEASSILDVTSIILTTVTFLVTLLADAFMALPGPVQTAIGTLLGIGFVIKAISNSIIGTLLMKIPLVAKVVQILVFNFKILMFILQGMAKSAMMFLFTNPIGWIILAVVALIALFVILWNKSEKFREIVKSIGQWFVDVWNNQIYPLVQATWQWMQDAWNKVYEIVSGIVSKVVNWFKNYWNDIKGEAQTLWGIMQTVWNAIWNVVSTVVGAIVNFFKSAWSVVSSVVSTVFGFISGIITGAFNIWKSIAMPFFSVLATWFMGLVSIVGSVIGLIVNIFKLGWNILRLVINVFILVFRVAFGVMAAIVMAIVNRIVAIFQFGWNIVSTVVRVAIDIILMIVGHIVTRVMGVVNALIGAWQWAWGIIQTVVGFVIGIIVGIIGNIIGVVQGILSTVWGIWTSVWNAVSGVVGSAMDGARGILDGFINWMRPVIDKVKQIWESVWGGVRDFVQGIIDKIKAGIDGISSVISGISSGIGKVADMLPGLATGGTVTVGMKALVGEVGPEAFVSNTGKVSMIGMHGPEVRKFPTSGYVVPNHVLGGKSDPSVPSNIMSKLGAAMQPSAAAYAGAHTEAPARHSQNTYMASPGDVPPIQINIERVDSQVDMEAAITSALRKWERQQRERK